MPIEYYANGFIEDYGNSGALAMLSNHNLTLINPSLYP